MDVKKNFRDFKRICKEKDFYEYNDWETQVNKELLEMECSEVINLLRKMQIVNERMKYREATNSNVSYINLAISSLLSMFVAISSIFMTWVVYLGNFELKASDYVLNPRELIKTSLTSGNDIIAQTAYMSVVVMVLLIASVMVSWINKINYSSGYANKIIYNIEIINLLKKELSRRNIIL